MDIFTLFGSITLTFVSHPGYHGLYCEEEYNECLSAPCQNYATCRDLINSYECVCTPQFEGVCDISCLALPPGGTKCVAAWVMPGCLLQANIVKSTRIRVWRCTARTEVAVRVRLSTPPASALLDTWVSLEMKTQEMGRKKKRQTLRKQRKAAVVKHKTSTKWCGLTTKRRKWKRRCDTNCIEVQHS